ncbi:hypothetical protein [Streptomyces sp. RKAG293]|uniref:hypothetical protein n=1 Tax=Streptomyces sp. RKAG293 TaxID=2893403 RepID=UPI0020342145|nr:hypothetical protein [Streptomyces sp. RKAG293]MCM2420279.1 hypothetical protein [Streptomyces sp. RKAG293]
MQRRRFTAAEAVRAVMVARQFLHRLPQVDVAQTTPVYAESPQHGARVAVHVHLVDVLGLPLAAGPDEHRAAYKILRRAYPRAAWTSDEYRYDVRRGALLRTTPALLGGAR